MAIDTNATTEVAKKIVETNTTVANLGEAVAHYVPTTFDIMLLPMIGIAFAAFVIFMIDKELFSYLYQKLTKPVREFVKKIRDPEQKLTYKDYYILAIVGIFAHLLMGGLFSILAILVIGVLFLNEYFYVNTENREQNKSFKAYISDFFERMMSLDEIRKMKIYEKIMVLLLISAPFSVLDGISRDLFSFGYMGVLLLILLVVPLLWLSYMEKLTGFEFSNIADFKSVAEKNAEIAELQDKIAAKEQEYKDQLIVKTQELKNANKKLETLEKGVKEALSGKKKTEMVDILSNLIED